MQRRSYLFADRIVDETHRCQPGREFSFIKESMNVSGTPEIVEVEEGIWFCRDHGIPLFLGDRECRPAVWGSFPILQVDWTGIRVVGGAT